MSSIMREYSKCLLIVTITSDSTAFCTVTAVFSTLAEATTAEITRAKDAQGLEQNKQAAEKGGSIAGETRIRIESETGKSIISSKNFLPEKKQKEIKDDKMEE